MEAKDLEIGVDYEMCRRWMGRRRVRLLEKKGYGFWRARCVRDKYSYGEPGQEMQIESRHLTRPWVEARAEYEQSELIAQEWSRARKQADREAAELIGDLSEFGVELEYSELEHGDDGLPGQATVYLAVPVEQLKRLSKSLKQGEIQPLDTPHSALSELI